jgi:quinol monooxygenase YgiN
VIAVLQFRPTEDEPTFLAQGQAALGAFAARPGFIRGTLGRATDDDTAWVLVTEWESVGAYRRGLGGYQVKLVATPFLAQALDRPSAFEALVSMGPDGVAEVRSSDRADDADWVGRGPSSVRGLAETP